MIWNLFLFSPLWFGYPRGIQTSGPRWGYNNHGQLGIENKIEQLIPLRLNLQLINIGIGYFNSFGINFNKEFYCWGDKNGLGIESEEDKVSPFKTNLLFNKLYSGFDYTFAIDLNNEIYSFGYNGFGQLGDGTKDDQQVAQKIGLKLIEKKKKPVIFKSLILNEKLDLLFYFWLE